MALTLVLVAAAPTAAAPLWRPRVASAAGWAAERQGTVSFAVRTDRRVWGRDARRAVPAVMRAVPSATNGQSVSF